MDQTLYELQRCYHDVVGAVFVRALGSKDDIASVIVSEPFIGDGGECDVADSMPAYLR